MALYLPLTLAITPIPTLPLTLTPTLTHTLNPPLPLTLPLTLAAIKEAVKAAAKLAGAQDAAPCGQGPRGSQGALVAPPPAQHGQGLQQAPQACIPHCAHQERAGPADGVPLAKGWAAA